MNVVDTIFLTFAAAGRGAYFREAVSQTEHALQSADLARRAGADEELVAASLLHDFGHLLHGLPEAEAGKTFDDRHEDGGADWLAQYFGPAVTDPIRLHVAAKRYLCAVEPTYLAGLSPASRESLAVQGGPFDADGVRAFEAEPHFRSAAALRRWDDAAKVPGKPVPDLESYRPMLERLVERRTTRG